MRQHVVPVTHDPSELERGAAEEPDDGFLVEDQVDDRPDERPEPNPLRDARQARQHLEHAGIVVENCRVDGSHEPGFPQRLDVDDGDGEALRNGDKLGKVGIFARENRPGVSDEVPRAHQGDANREADAVDDGYSSGSLLQGERRVAVHVDVCGPRLSGRLGLSVFHRLGELHGRSWGVDNDRGCLEVSIVL